VKSAIKVAAAWPLSPRGCLGSVVEQLQPGSVGWIESSGFVGTSGF